MIEREWYDLYLLLLYIFFGYFKAIRIGGDLRLAWALRVYNATVSSVFLFAVVFMPTLNWPLSLEHGILSLGRALMVATITWAIAEIELARGTSFKLVLLAIGVMTLIALVMALAWPYDPSGPSPAGG